jgi:UrcA family protein
MIDISSGGTWETLQRRRSEAGLLKSSKRRPVARTKLQREEIMHTFTAIASAALVSLVAGHAFAQTDSDARHASVSYADLDLSRASGRTVLQQRLEKAIDRVCPGRPGPGELINLASGQKCREQAWAGAQRQLAVIYDGRSLAAASIQVGPGQR